MTAVSCTRVKQRLNVDLRHTRVLVRVQVYSSRWNNIRPPTALQNPPPHPSPLSLMYLPPLRVLSISQRTRRCQEVRDLQKGERTVFLEMSLCFMASCAAIKHLLGRQLIYQACLLFFFFLPSSHSLRGQFPSRCCLPICVFFSGKRNESENRIKCPKKCARIRLMMCTACLFTEIRVSVGLRKLGPRLHLSSPDSSLCRVCLTGVNIACWL